MPHLRLGADSGSEIQDWCCDFSGVTLCSGHPGSRLYLVHGSVFGKLLLAVSQNWFHLSSHWERPVTLCAYCATALFVEDLAYMHSGLNLPGEYC